MRASKREGGVGWSVAQAAGGRPDCGGSEGGARAERTENMDRMSVTLDVSRLSGWLNARAICGVARGIVGRGATCGQAGGRVGRGGRWRKQQGGPDLGG